MTWQVDHSADGLTLTWSPLPESLDVSWRWLRDHGEDPESHDHATAQRRINALNREIAPATSAQVVTAHDPPALHLAWPDEPRATWISLATLEELATRADARGVGALQTPDGHSDVSGPRPWRSATDIDLEVGDVDAVLADDDALARWLGELATWGVARLQGFDGTHEQARKLADRIGYVRETIFGGLWDLASDISDHDDTAYSQSFLAPHTDGTYSHDAPGLQMFCCSARTGTGGESIIVDGRAIADDIRSDHPDAFRLLTSIPVPAHYIEPGVELRACRPALRLDPLTGDFQQLSLNNYDRSPMLLAPEQMAAFYDAYGLLQALADDEQRWLSVRLEAGDVLINDNWRVLHGRRAYTGERRFVGCYLNHEDFEGRCRTLGIPL